MRSRNEKTKTKRLKSERSACLVITCKDLAILFNTLNNLFVEYAYFLTIWVIKIFLQHIAVSPRGNLIPSKVGDQSDICYL